MRLALAHIVELFHSVMLRHWPHWQWLCRVVMELWPNDAVCDCWMCRRYDWKSEEEA